MLLCDQQKCLDIFPYLTPIYTQILLVDENSEEKKSTSPLSWFTGQHMGSACFPQRAWRSPRSWQNSVIGHTEGKGCCHWRQTSQDFQLSFWRTGLSFLTSVNNTQLLAEKHCEKFSILTGKELMTLKSAPRQGGTLTDSIDFSEILLELWLLATWSAPKNQALRWPEFRQVCPGYSN